MVDRIVFWLSAGVCSQRPAHSFFLGGQQLPLCARDLGLFGGFLMMAVVLNLAGRRPRFSSLWLVSVIPLSIDGLNSIGFDASGGGLYQPNNLVRLSTGLMAGIGMAVVLAPRFRPWPMLALTVGLAGLGIRSEYTGVALVGTVGVAVLLVAATRFVAVSLGLNLPRAGASVWGFALLELSVLAVMAHVWQATLSVAGPT